MGRGSEHIEWPIHLEVARVTVRAKAAVEAAGGSVRRVYYNKLGFKALLKPEWFEKKGRLLPKAARPPPKQADKVDSIGRLPAPIKPIPFVYEEKEVLHLCLLRLPDYQYYVSQFSHVMASLVRIQFSFLSV